MTVYTAKHLSGLGSVDLAVFKAALARQLVLEPEFVSHTEMGRDGRSRALFTFPDYDVAHVDGTDGRDECAMQIHHTGPQPLEVKPVQLSTLGIPRRGGKLCVGLHVRFADHHRIIVHMPSGVEGLTGIRRNAQGAVYRQALTELAAYVELLGGRVVITGDWNLSLRRRWVRRLLAVHFPGFTPTWPAGHLPRLGTHGRRVIDFSLVRGFTVTAAHVVPSFGASDHRAISETHKEISVTHGLYPAAHQLPIAPGSNDPAIVPRLAILHVDAGNADSLFHYFNGPSGGIESHFFVKKDGGVEQYRNIFRQADANLDANDFAVSIETQGFGAGVWTAEQLTSIKKLLVWLHDEAQVPLVRVPRWDGAGVGYHVMFGAPGHWTPSVKSCPGPDRIRQFETLLIPWMKNRTNPPAPTRVEQARALLGAAHARALAKGNARRAAMILAALNTLPRR